MLDAITIFSNQARVEEYLSRSKLLLLYFDTFSVRQWIFFLIILQQRGSSHWAALFFDVSHELPLECCRKDNLVLQELHQVFIYISASNVQSFNGMRLDISFYDGNSCSDTLSTLKHKSWLLAFSIESVQSMHRSLKLWNSIFLKHQLCKFFSVLHRI